MGKKKDRKKRSLSYSPSELTATAKTSRTVSPLALGLYLAPELLDSSKSGLSQSNMMNGQPPQTTPVSVPHQIPNGVSYTTPTGQSMQSMQSPPPTRPAISLNLPSQDQFNGLADSDKLNFIFAQNNAILANQSYHSEILMKTLQTLSQQVVLQQQQIGLLQQQQQHLSSFNRYNLASAFLDIQEDKLEREAKKDNLVCYGLQEPVITEGAKTDMDIIMDSFTAAGADPLVITKVDRLGDPRPADKFPRPLKIFTSSYEDKLKVLTGQKKIFSIVPQFKESKLSHWFRPDLTRMQREQDYLLREELKRARLENPAKQLIIRGDKIIERPKANPPMQF